MPSKLISQWTLHLPVKLRQSFKSNLAKAHEAKATEKGIYKRIFKDLSSVISAAFAWDRTSEGRLVWLNLYLEAFKQEQESNFNFRYTWKTLILPDVEE